MILVQSYIRRGQNVLRRWLLEPVVHTVLRAAGYALAGLCLSAAALAGRFLPLALCLVCGCGGWASVMAALGAAGGYLLFWDSGGYQTLVWLLSGMVCSVILSLWQVHRQLPLLMPSLSGLIVAVCGLIFPSNGKGFADFVFYLLRVGIAFGGTWLCHLVTERRSKMLDWLACGIGVFSLAQIMPIPYIGLGYIAAGALTVGAPFPVAALAGLALDLAQITKVPMTAVMILAFLVRFLPRSPAWLRMAAPGAVFAGLLYLGGFTDLLPLPGLLLGGLLGKFLPPPGKAIYHRGETGVAQVRLEVAAGVLNQTRQLLMEVQPIPVDEAALVDRATQRACSSCPYRKSCKDTRRMDQLPETVLRKPLLRPEELPIMCRKSGRVLAELHRSQEQLRAIEADRQRQGEYRAAVVQQYGFLSEFLQDLADQLVRRTANTAQLFEPRVEVYGNRPEADNGDKCLRFMGTGGKFYVLLCDGMGTGLGAVQESRLAAGLLQRLLTAGFPTAYALRSLNNLCTLRDRAAAVTLDLAEIALDSGKTVLYKWGAAPSYLISHGGAERIGTVSVPPGLSVTGQTETAHRLTLRRNQLLILASDGIETEEALRCCIEGVEEPPGELAARLLSGCNHRTSDDATVVMVQLAQK